MPIWYWFLQVTGTASESSKYYAFWSGFGGDLAIFGAIAGLYKKNNCHARWCWRLGHHVLEGTPYKVCRKHHPDLPDKAPTATELQDLRTQQEECPPS